MMIEVGVVVAVVVVVSGGLSVQSSFVMVDDGNF